MSKEKKIFPKITLTKLDVALRQLKEAIHLFFEERDDVSIHTLAMASYQILYDIAKKRDIKDIMYDSLIIKDEHRGLAKQYLNKSKNFFKHADRDPKEEHEFPLDINDYMLMCCVTLIEKMEIQKNIEHTLFPWWFICTHKDLVEEEFLKTQGMVMFMRNDHVKDKKIWLSILREFKTHEQFQKWLELLSIKSELQQNQEVYDIFLKPYDDLG